MAIAKDIMTLKPFVLGSGMEISEAIEFFNEHNITSAPVINPLGEIMGQLTEMELVIALVQQRAKDSKVKKLAHIQELFDPVTFVQESDHVGQVLRIMMKAPSHRVLVKNSKDKMVGIISPKDVLRSIKGSEEKVAQTLMDEVRALTEEVSELKSKIKDMADYLDVYECIFQSGVYMLHSADEEGRIRLANEELHLVLGYEPGELLNKSIFDIYPPTVHGEVRAGLKRVLTEGHHMVTFSSMKKKSGAIIRVEITSAALTDDEGNKKGTFTISREIDSEALLKALHGIGKRYSEM